MSRVRSSVLAASLAGLAGITCATGAFAVDAVVQSVTGEARAQIDLRHNPVTANQRLLPGTTISTAQDAQVVLRFDNGQVVVVNESSQLKIGGYRFTQVKGEPDALVLSKGAVRVVSGSATANAAEVRAPHVTVRPRGESDFMVALINPAYITVLKGSVAATNAAGTVVLGAGSTAMTANAAALTTAVSSTPGPIAGAFSSMGAAPTTVTVAGGAAGGAAGAAAAGGVTAAGAAGIAAAAAAAAAAAGGGGGTTTTTHH